MDENERVNVRFFEGGVRAYPLNLLFYVFRSRLAQLLIYTALIMTGTTRRIFREGKALLLKVGSAIQTSARQLKNQEAKNGGSGCPAGERTRVRLW